VLANLAAIDHQTRNGKQYVVIVSSGINAFTSESPTPAG
jgi:hypothetical protein